jgi:hypothetical protein
VVTTTLVLFAGSKSIDRREPRRRLVQSLSCRTTVPICSLEGLFGSVSVCMWRALIQFSAFCEKLG